MIVYMVLLSVSSMRMEFFRKNTCQNFPGTSIYKKEKMKIFFSDACERR